MASSSPRQPVDVRTAKALSHPLRQRLLLAYTGKVTSPSELAGELGAPLGDVSYHTKFLHRQGLLELVRTERRRGAVKHYYRAIVPVIEDPEWAALPAVERRELAERILADVWRDLGRARDAGGLQDERVHITRLPLALDAAAWAELGGLLRDLVDRALELQARSEAGSAATAPTELALLHFRRAPE